MVKGQIKSWVHRTGAESSTPEQKITHIALPVENWEELRGKLCTKHGITEGVAEDWPVFTLVAGHSSDFPVSVFSSEEFNELVESGMVSLRVEADGESAIRRAELDKANKQVSFEEPEALENRVQQKQQEYLAQEKDDFRSNFDRLSREGVDMITNYQIPQHKEETEQQQALSHATPIKTNTSAYSTGVYGKKLVVSTEKEGWGESSLLRKRGFDSIALYDSAIGGGTDRERQLREVFSRLDRDEKGSIPKVDVLGVVDAGDRAGNACKCNRGN